MFLHQLTSAQRRVFLRLAQLLIKLDRVVDIREEVALEAALREMGMAIQDLPPAPASLAEVLPELAACDTLEARRVLLLELVIVLCSDHDVDPREMKAVRQVCDKLDLEEELLPRFQVTAHEWHGLLERARALISPEWDQSGEGWLEEEDGAP